MSVYTIKEAIDEIQKIKWLIDEGPAHVKLTDAQTRLSELKVDLSTIEEDLVRSDEQVRKQFANANIFKTRAEKTEIDCAEWKKRSERLIAGIQSAVDSYREKDMQNMRRIECGENPPEPCMMIEINRLATLLRDTIRESKS